MQVAETSFEVGHMGLGWMRRQAACVMAGLTAPVLAILISAAGETSLPATPEAFGQALKAWTAEHRIKRAFVVVRREGRIVHRSALGGANPDARVHLASLSKAITAACVASLIRGGRLGFETPISSALKRFIAAHGKPRDPRVAGVTVAELLTHRAGFAVSDDDDPASGRNLDRYLETHSSRAPPGPSLLAATLRAKLVQAPGARFAYGNAGYFVLGGIIEEAGGRPYASYCGDAVLKPLGIAADLEPAWRVSSSMGGWRMRAADYLTFLDLFAADDARLGAAVKAWMLDRAGKSVPFDETVWYGLGTYLRTAERGVDLWHWGSWDYTPEPGERGTVRTSFAAYAKRLSDGTAWFVHVEPRVEEGAPRTDLDGALVDAYRAVKSWH
jgi:CubicO group peptidase (beta-lactamase class C family)